MSADSTTRIALGVRYAGNDWHGWQTQPGRHTVQDRLEEALSAFADRPVRTICAGRTDTGVHGIGQVVHFDSDAPRAVAAWVRGTNAWLPPSIAVQWACAVSDNFHARFSATHRRYDYLLYNHPVRSPLWQGRAGWTHRPLDLARMRAAAVHLVGRHDFSAFRSSECQAKSPVRELDTLEIRRHGDLFVFTLGANGFLHHMVRNIVGSLIAVGAGREEPEWLAGVLAGRDRSRAAPTFMPDGLYLTTVRYPEAFGLPPPAGLEAVFPGLTSDPTPHSTQMSNPDPTRA